MPPADGAAQGVKFDLTVVLCSLMNMLTTDLSRSQDVMAVMRLVASVGSSPAEHPNAALLLPTLRNDEVLMHNLVTLGFHWVERAAGGAQAQEPLNILAGLASPCNSADLPSARASVTLMRQRPNFRPSPRGLAEAGARLARPRRAAHRRLPARARAPAPPARRRPTPRPALRAGAVRAARHWRRSESSLGDGAEPLLGRAAGDAAAVARRRVGARDGSRRPRARARAGAGAQADDRDARGARRRGGRRRALRRRRAAAADHFGARASTPLVATLHERGLLAPVEQLFGCLLRLAAASMRLDARR